MMKKETGDRRFPIWLLGDSNPTQWQDVLELPFDPRHPIIHNIWTPVIDVIQDRVFRECNSRVDTSRIYVRNAVENPKIRPPESSLNWSGKVIHELSEFQKNIFSNRPCFLFTFGRFSFEFARRTLNEEPMRKVNYYGAENLGVEFRTRIDAFDIDEINLIPLLHRSISGGKFIESHNYFCDQEGSNYFDYVGNCIADKLIENYDNLSVGIET